jgi:hypothetical protein
LANSCASPEELSEIVRETLAAIQMRRGKISCSDVEKCLGLSSSQVMNLFMKYRIERISEAWDGTDWRQ